MSTANSKTRRSGSCSVRRFAWLIGVERGRVSHAIRTGALRCERGRGGLAIPAAELARVLNGGERR